MTSDDDEALSWAGDDADPTASSGPVTAHRSRSTRGGTTDDADPTASSGPVTAHRTRSAWDGTTDDADPTASPSPVTAHRSRSAHASSNDGGDEGESTGTGDNAESTRQTSSVALVVMSLLGGFLVLDGLGWGLSIGPLQAAFRPIDLLGTTMFSLGLVFAVASPFVWLGASMWLTRSRPSWQRIAALAIGAVLLVPWPYLVGCVDRA
jgi:hypothetical protein